MPEYIYVLGMDGKPQMPTTRRRHVQKLLDTGKARIAESVPFTIQLLYDNDPVLQPVTLAGEEVWDDDQSRHGDAEASAV